MCVCVCFFLSPTIEVVTFRLRGWCTLGVFLLPAFTRLGHAYQDFLSPSDEMDVPTDYISVYTLIRKSFGEWSQNLCLLQEETPTGDSEEGRTRHIGSHRTASRTHYQLSYSGPGQDCGAGSRRRSKDNIAGRAASAAPIASCLDSKGRPLATVNTAQGRQCCPNRPLLSRDLT